MNKKIMIVYLGILAAMAPLATDMYLPALPELQAEFGSTTSMTQLTLTMTMMGMALGQIFAGPVSDLRGRKIPLLLGMLIFMASSLVCVHKQYIHLFGSPFDSGAGRSLRHCHCPRYCQGYVPGG